MMQSFFNFRTKEYDGMQKSKALCKKLTNKRKSQDPRIFYPKFGPECTKHQDMDTNYIQSDGYTQRKLKEKKSTMYVRRKIDFKMIENTIQGIAIKDSINSKGDSSGAIKPEKVSLLKSLLHSKNNKPSKRWSRSIKCPQAL